MKIACKSAYTQKDTLNFTFARQAVIVYLFQPQTWLLSQRYNLSLHNSYNL